MLCFGKVEVGLRSEAGIVDVREEPIMDKACNLLEVGDDSLGKAFIVTEFMQEVVTADNDDFSTYIPKPGQKRALELAMTCAKRTDEVQTENFTVLLVQEHIRISRCLPVDAGEISQEWDFSGLRNRVCHEGLGDGEVGSDRE